MNPTQRIDIRNSTARILQVVARRRQGPEELRLQDGIREARSGNKALARQIFASICRAEPNNDTAWLWRASVSASKAEAVEALAHVMRIRPENETARAWLERLTETEAAPESYQCPLCDFESAEDFDRCPGCRAWLLMDVECAARNDAADEPRIRKALRALEPVKVNDPFEYHYWTAVAYLNLRQAGEAGRHMRKALQYRPDKMELRRELVILGNRKLVLTVDDSMTVRSTIVRTVERNGYRAVEASNGVDCLSMVDEEMPALILLDVSMPGMDGYQTAKKMRSNPSTKHIPVVMLSGKDGFFDKVKGRLAGAEEYITKPVEPPKLLRTLKKYLG